MAAEQVAPDVPCAWADGGVRAVLATLPPARQAAIAARGKPAHVFRCRRCATPLILAYRRAGPIYLCGADFHLGACPRRVATIYCPACGSPRVYTER